MLSIQTNVNSMQAQENLRLTNQFQGRTIARLTSGYRINESGDDAAGLAVANKYRSDVTELMQGVRNANDGLSTLQIIDGGLNNISKMLDRLKTLATQSASATFTGSRATLNQEYQSLLTEIDRQANNVGLGEGTSTGTAARNNKKIAVYVGGGADLMNNSKVTIDLSTGADKVNSLSLGLQGTKIDGSAGAGLSNSRDLVTTSTGHLANNATQQVTVNTATGQVVATLIGTVAGISSQEMITQLNTQIASTGVSASINQSTGAVEFTSGNTAFTVNVADSTVTNTGLTSGGAGGTAVVQSMYKMTGDGTYATPVDVPNDGQAMTVVIGSQTVNVTIAQTATTVGAAVSSMNAQLNSYGIYAVQNADGNDFSLYSTQSFTVASEQVTTSGGWAVNNQDVVAGAVAAQSAAQPSSSTTSPEIAAQNAITSIQDAVAKLGTVQGKIGTGQNQLQYAIQLAQSQITSFSAAESRIRDADVAQEAANLTKAQVLQQASLAALAQANSAPQAVLSLLRG